MALWPKDFWPPYSPDANPLDYAFWPHIEAKASKVRHRNIEALKAAVNEEWNLMTSDYVVKVCKAFRKRLTAIVEADGGYIDD